MTKTIRTVIAGAALLALAACGASDGTKAPAGSVKAVAPPAGTTWESTVSVTPDGGYLMGNPNAPIKLLEYGSVTCPACQAFAVTGFEPLTKNYVATGKVSFEFRSFLIHAPDVMATSLLECGGPQPFFAMLEANYAGLNEWEGKIQALPQADLQRIQGLPVAQQSTELARVSGLDQFVIQRGVSSEAAAKCLTDPKTPDRLVAQSKKGSEVFKVEHTPTFFINGKEAEEVGTWKDLELELKAAGA